MRYGAGASGGPLAAGRWPLAAGITASAGQRLALAVGLIADHILAVAPIVLGTGPGGAPNGHCRGAAPVRVSPGSRWAWAQACSRFSTMASACWATR